MMLFRIDFTRHLAYNHLRGRIRTDSLCFHGKWADRTRTLLALMEHTGGVWGGFLKKNWAENTPHRGRASLDGAHFLRLKWEKRCWWWLQTSWFESWIFFYTYYRDAPLGAKFKLQSMWGTLSAKYWFLYPRGAEENCHPFFRQIWVAKMIILFNPKAV